MRYKLILILFVILPVVYAFSVGQFKVERENYCGDSILGGIEECDLDNLNSQTCITRGYDSGTLTCTEGCMLDESLCSFNISPSPDESGGGGGGGGRTQTEFPEVSSSQCADKIDNDNDGKIDMYDSGCTNGFDNSEEDSSCYEDWRCDSWGNCINEVQTRTCRDNRKCKQDYFKLEKRKCIELIPEFPTSCYFLALPCYFWIILILLIIIFSILIINKIYSRYRKKLRK